MMGRGKSGKLIPVLILSILLCGFDDDIHSLASKGDVSGVVKACRENPGLINATDDKGNTPLHLASAHGKLKVMRSLLAIGASLEQRNEQGMSPLGAAVYYGNCSAVKLLVQKGANPGEKFWKYDNHSLPEIITLRGNVDIASYFLETGVDFLAYEKVGGSLISLAAFDRDVEMLKFLLSIGANPDGSKSGLAPLHLAIDESKGIYLEEKAIKFVNILVKGGADINALDNRKWTLLQRAASNGQFEIVRTFYKAKARINLFVGCRKSPEKLAQENKHEEIAEYLIRMEKLK